MSETQIDPQRKTNPEEEAQYSVCMEIAAAESIPETNYKAPTVEECNK